MTAPWGKAPAPDRRGPKDFIGRPVFIITGGVRRNVPGQFGMSDIPHVTIVSLAGPDAGGIYTEVFLFGAAGRQIAKTDPGYVSLVTPQEKGKSITLDDPSRWDEQAAANWYDAHPGLLDQLRGEAVREFNDWRPPVQEQQYGVMPAQQGYQTQATQPQYAQAQYAPPPPNGAPPPPPPPGVPHVPQYQPSPGHHDLLKPPPPPPPTGYQPAPNPNYNAQLREQSPTLESMRAADHIGQSSDIPF
jgi:hypothetical protein